MRVCLNGFRIHQYGKHQSPLKFLMLNFGRSCEILNRRSYFSRTWLIDLWGGGRNVFSTPSRRYIKREAFEKRALSRNGGYQKPPWLSGKRREFYPPAETDNGRFYDGRSCQSAPQAANAAWRWLRSEYNGATSYTWQLKKTLVLVAGAGSGTNPWKVKRLQASGNQDCTARSLFSEEKVHFVFFVAR